MPRLPATGLTSLSSSHADIGLTAVLDGVGIAVVMIDAAGTIQELNAAADRMFGYPTGDLPGQNVRLLMPRQHADHHDDYLARYLRTGEAHIIGKGRKTVAVRRGGQTFPIHLAVGQLATDAGIRFIGVIHDLTEHDHAQDAAARLGEIVEASVNEVFVFDRHTWRFSYVNDSAVRNLGYSRAEFAVMTPVDVKPDYDRQRFAALLEPLASGALSRIQFETIHQRKDGTRYPVDIDLHLSDAVIPSEFVAITRDVSERKSMAEALVNAQKLELVGQLTGGIAHDFNNLLTVMSGNLELLEHQLDAPNQLKLVDNARQAAGMGARLTQRLLSFARRSHLAPEVLDLNALIVDLTELIRRSLESTISLSLDLCPELWPIHADRSHLENALLNLGLNARDSMNGKGRMTIRTVNRVIGADEARDLQVQPGNHVAVRVSDTGCGIAEVDLPRVFEPFYSTKGKDHGNGLGLSMLYGFIKQSDGGVHCESEVGKGSRFTLYLPACGDVGAASEAVSAVQGSHRVRLLSARSSTVLVVDDEAMVRELTLQRLRKLGHVVLEAADGQEALQRIAEHPSIDLLFSDIVMPGGMSGIELCARVRQHNPSIKVLLTTGYVDDLAASDALQQGGVVILQKPYDEATLVRTLQQVLTS